MKKPSAIKPLLWVMLFDHTSLNITFPVLTLLFFDVHSSLFASDTSNAIRSLWYGLGVSIPHLVNLIFTPLLSAASDIFGRKKILFIGTLGAFGFALIATISIFWGILNLLLFALIIRGAFSRTNPIAQAAIGDVAPSAKKVVYMGYLQTAISIGAFVGPLLGGYFASTYFFATFNFALPFIIAAVFAAIASLLTWLIFAETLSAPKTHVWHSPWHWQQLARLMRHPNVWRISLILLLSQISWSMYYQFMPPILKTTLHFDAHDLGLFVGLIAFWLALATTGGIRLLQRWFSPEQILYGSLWAVFLGTALSFILCLLPTTYYNETLIWLAAIPTAMGDVIAYSCLTACYSNAVELSDQGKVMGICFIIVALVWALTGLIGGVAMGYFNLLPLLIAPIGALLSLGCCKTVFSPY